MTHFLVTDCLLTDTPTWNWRLNRLACYGVSDAQAAGDHLARMDPTARALWLEEREVEIQSPPAPAMLRPEDLSRFDPALVSWGSHTVSHANLGACSDDLARGS